MADDTSDMVDVTIRIETAQAGRLDEIVRALVASGLDRVESHARFMIVNGCVSAGALRCAAQGRGRRHRCGRTRPTGRRRPERPRAFGMPLTSPVAQSAPVASAEPIR